MTDTTKEHAQWMREAADEIVDQFNRTQSRFQFGMAWERSTEEIIAKHMARAEQSTETPIGTPEECPTCESDLQEARNFGNHTVSGWINSFDGTETCSDPWHDGPVGTPEGKKP